MIIRLRQIENFLIENGMVYIVAPTKYTQEITTFKEYKVRRTFIMEITKWEQLKEFFPKSGYDDLEQWIYWIKCFLCRSGVRLLYRVEIIYD